MRLDLGRNDIREWLSVLLSVGIVCCAVSAAPSITRAREAIKAPGINAKQSQPAAPADALPTKSAESGQTEPSQSEPTPSGSGQAPSDATAADNAEGAAPGNDTADARPSSDGPKAGSQDPFYLDTPPRPGIAAAEPVEPNATGAQTGAQTGAKTAAESAGDTKSVEADPAAKDPTAKDVAGKFKLPDRVDPDARARDLLAAEGKAGMKLHPLQQAKPDRNLIVCEAGCGGTKIVYDGARAKPATEAAPAEQGRTRNAYCKGGCYPFTTGFTNAGGHSPPSAAAPRLLDDSAGRWMTTLMPADKAPAAAPSPAAKKSAEKTNPEKPNPAASPLNALASPSKPAVGATAAPAASAVAPGPAADALPKAKRDDWMARINRAREAEKPSVADKPDTANQAQPAGALPPG